MVRYKWVGLAKYVMQRVKVCKYVYINMYVRYICVCMCICVRISSELIVIKFSRN